MEFIALPSVPDCHRTLSIPSGKAGVRCQTAFFRLLERSKQHCSEKRMDRRFSGFVSPIDNIDAGFQPDRMT